MMFTGIVEELGTIEKISQLNRTLELTVSASEVTKDMKLGDSIAVNGVCLTVTDFSEDYFTMDVMPETFHHTSLSLLKHQSSINLERALLADDRFGGHFVSGHVDGVGEVINKTKAENAIEIQISLSADLAKFVLMKGSIAIDGVSLTVFGIENNILTISIIPHTAKETVLGSIDGGDIVNVEADMLAKHLHAFLHAQVEIDIIFINEGSFTMFLVIEDAIKNLQEGKMVIVCDDEDRENEGDLLAIAEYVTPETINFMTKVGRGLVCMPVMESLAQKLELAPMTMHNTDKLATAFTVSVDHKETSTGISAFERAFTIQKMLNKSAVSDDFARPGHIFPLIAKNDGVFERNGHTEAAVDFARLA